MGAKSISAIILIPERAYIPESIVWNSIHVMQALLGMVCNCTCTLWQITSSLSKEWWITHLISPNEVTNNLFLYNKWQPGSPKSKALNDLVVIVKGGCNY